MQKKSKLLTIQHILNELYPDPPVPLTHSNPYTLLIAVLLSAQCTDKRVNIITKELFELADTPEKMVKLGPEKIENIIRSCGLAPSKSKSIWNLSKILIETYGGQVPNDIEALETLPGVGHKTASVVMAQAFKTPAFPVDTHIHRCAKRWGLSEGKNVKQTENDLKKLFPKKLWTKLHLQIIYFAREYCQARNHDSKKCPICSLSLKFFLFFLIPFCMLSCQNDHSSSQYGDKARKKNMSGEYIYRHHDDYRFSIPPMEVVKPASYPWESEGDSPFPKITKEFFRCKGSSLNPPRIVTQNGKSNGNEATRYYDCGGSAKHSLPLKDGKEFIYPILIELLNYIQEKTKKKVIITSGHRCIEHNTFVDSSKENSYSKHLIGAEVSFYVQGLESDPKGIVKMIMEFYLNNDRYRDQKVYTDFQRYEKSEDVTIQPWFNKEVFVKIFQKKEGRNHDNRHPYPYISIQVRHDWDTDEKVTYSWEQAQQFYRK